MSDIKIPQELLNVIADINFDEIQSQSYSPSHFRNWLCAWHERIKTELYDFANNHELYSQGRADKYQEIVSEYMLLTEVQVNQIRADAFADCVLENGEYCWQECCATEHCKECKWLGNGDTIWFEQIQKVNFVSFEE